MNKKFKCPDCGNTKFAIEELIRYEGFIDGDSAIIEKDKGRKLKVYCKKCEIKPICEVSAEDFSKKIKRVIFMGDEE